MIVEYVTHSDIPNYTKLAFNSLKMIQNDTVSRPIKRGMIDFAHRTAYAVRTIVVIAVVRCVSRLRSLPLSVCPQHPFMLADLGQRHALELLEKAYSSNTQYVDPSDTDADDVSRPTMLPSRVGPRSREICNLPVIFFTFYFF